MHKNECATLARTAMNCASPPSASLLHIILVSCYHQIFCVEDPCFCSTTSTIIQAVYIIREHLYLNSTTIPVVSPSLKPCVFSSVWRVLSCLHWMATPYSHSILCVRFACRGFMPISSRSFYASRNAFKQLLGNGRLEGRARLSQGITDSPFRDLACRLTRRHQAP
jgi:hypothetical protein